MQASHSCPVSEVVSRPFWRPGSSVARTIMRDRDERDAERLEQRRARPLAGSRRLVSALKTVPRPITTNVIVSDAVGTSVLGSSGPAHERDERGDEQRRARRRPRGSRRARLVIGSFGSRGGRCMTSGAPGSTAMTTTPAAVTKTSR